MDHGDDVKHNESNVNISEIEEKERMSVFMTCFQNE